MAEQDLLCSIKFAEHKLLELLLSALMVGINVYPDSHLAKLWHYFGSLHHAVCSRCTENGPKIPGSFLNTQYYCSA